MRPVRQFAGGGAAALALAFSGHALDQAVGSPERAPQAAPVASVCAEDAPCWTWSRMGNRSRGVLVDGARRVVGPCTFRRFVIAGLVDRQAEPLRGDSWAIEHGCGDAPQLGIHASGVVEG